MTHLEKKHEKTFAIAWGDMDALGHVNNAKYFEYFQEARIEWLSTLQLDLKKQEGPVIVHTACSFLKPVFYPAILTIKSTFGDLGKTSMVMHHDIYQNDILMAQGMSKIVWVNYKEGKAVPIPQAIRDLLA